MGTRVSAVVTPGDVKNYVSTKGVDVKEKDGALIVSSKSYEFEFEPKEYRYRVSIEAVDDPSDAETKVTSEPLKFITKFLGAEIPGGEVFERMSSSPDAAASALRLVASSVTSGKIGPRATARVLRRAAVMASDPVSAMRLVLAAVTGIARGKSLDDFQLLRDTMKEKGWRVKETENDAGNPELVVDVSGIYEARVSVDSLNWRYSLSTVGFPDLDQEGETSDPITEIRKYVKSEPVQEAVSKRSLETGDTEAALSQGKTRKAPQEEKTVAPGKGAPQEEKTVAPRRSEETVAP